MKPLTVAVDGKGWREHAVGVCVLNRRLAHDFEIMFAAFPSCVFTLNEKKTGTSQEYRSDRKDDKNRQYP